MACLSASLEMSVETCRPQKGTEHSLKSAAGTCNGGLAPGFSEDPADLGSEGKSQSWDSFPVSKARLVLR